MVKRFIGLSLSGCIPDIVNGDVDLTKVHCIITNTRCDDRDAFIAVVDRYSKTLGRCSPWAVRTSEASEAAMLLYDTGRIVQPRVTRMDHPYFLVETSNYLEKFPFENWTLYEKSKDILRNYLSLVGRSDAQLPVVRQTS